MATKGDLSRMYRNFSGTKGPQDFMSKADVDAAIAAIPASGTMYLHTVYVQDSNNKITAMFVVSYSSEKFEYFSDACDAVTSDNTAFICPASSATSFDGIDYIALTVIDNGSNSTLLVVSTGSTPALSQLTITDDPEADDIVFDLSTGEEVPSDDSEE